jgi:hypothetical protein
MTQYLTDITEAVELVEAVEVHLATARGQLTLAIRNAKDAGFTYEVIGRMMGLSRQRVQQLAEREVPEGLRLPGRLEDVDVDQLSAAVHGSRIYRPGQPADTDSIERARTLAELHRLPLIDLAVTGVADEAVAVIPLQVLTRVVAIPYAVDETSLRVALGDPSNVHAVDEIRLAAGRPVEFAVAPREDIFAELQRLFNVELSRPHHSYALCSPSRESLILSQRDERRRRRRQDQS